MNQDVVDFLQGVLLGTTKSHRAKDAIKGRLQA
jgi:hypothetical protein